MTRTRSQSLMRKRLFERALSRSWSKSSVGEARPVASQVSARVEAAEGRPRNPPPRSDSDSREVDRA
eukprot:CAMPEP_0118856616 /NCGR_PEP_ID=MMETSP1163-20130328/4019_1 /TAXON_ID=124430 /ORGANISM="Phaeomonas parva, Strain CCMP2877" /LENGTH=66 /DNA_ID=CAMNT_0006789747 /DNA_START=161 /DNA_END=361 /DNA_ORIENTATION=+